MTEPKPPTAAASASASAEELAVRARDGCRASFDELVIRYRPRLVAFVARRLADPGDAEDVAQETFLRAYDRLAQYDPSRPFATWLFTIGKNVAVNHAIARGRRDARDRNSRPAEAAAEAAIEDGAGAGDLWPRARE